MQLNRSSLVVEYRLVAQFSTLREHLLRAKYADRLDKPLAFWTVPNDRRLPLAFMGRTVRDLLDTPFEALLATPGVGQKKITSLLKLLERVATEEPVVPKSQPAPAPNAAVETNGEPVDSINVSEAVWSQWCESIRQFGLERQPLGRFAPSLESLPTVLWNTPLGTYVDLNLGEIRSLKTHGEKRVQAVLAVFGELHSILSSLGPARTLSIRILPRLISNVESWVVATFEQNPSATIEQVEQHVIRPLIEQIRIDAGDGIAQMVEDRLGVAGQGTSVRQAARNLGLTRARIYQLLADVGAILAVRWPEGQYLVGHLSEKLQAQAPAPVGLQRFLTAVDIFFPQRRHGVAHEEVTNEHKSEDVDAPLGHRRAG